MTTTTTTMQSSTTTSTTQQYYPIDWPYDMPFHKGELEMQHQAGPGVHESVMSYAPKVIRPYMPDQHRAFYQDLPFIVAAARDGDDNLWATLIMNPNVIDNSNNSKNDLSAIASPDPVTLQLPTRLVPGDALDTSAWGKPGMDLGLLGIDFASARRNRVNGWVNVDTTDTEDSKFLSMHVTQSFGNCPQYIASRQWWSPTSTSTTTSMHDEDMKDDATTSSSSGSTSTSTSSLRSQSLRPEQIRLLEQAETIFVATGYRGEGANDVRYGNDASHRGGPAGFVRVSPDGTTITLPEFHGNNHFNSLGNLLLDNHMGITVPLLEQGGMLQLTGTAVVDMDTKRAAALYPGALRLVTLTVTQVNQVLDGTLPVRWNVDSASQQRNLRVVAKVPESANVTSFYLEPVLSSSSVSSCSSSSQTCPELEPPLWDFSPGQHLPIRLVTTAGDLQRTYSLSAAPAVQANQYRISVKRESQGRASRFLHDQVQVGDIIQARKPAGDFVLSQSQTETNSKKKKEANRRTVVLLSTGVGVTPLLSMLQHLVAPSNNSNSNSNTNADDNNKVVWIHGARDGANHAFRDEVNDLTKKAKNTMTNSPVAVAVQTHIVYSRPTEQDKDAGHYDSMGRIDATLVQTLVPDLSHADFYLCGPGGFMASVTEGLEQLGVDPQYIHFEIF
jgi:ferredoxin-NADP reductase/predicted pyridoxine 5'-phosphate oxidase superfamily flavin-nucleotide-binding protein